MQKTKFRRRMKKKNVIVEKAKDVKEGKNQNFKTSLKKQNNGTVRNTLIIKLNR